MLDVHASLIHHREVRHRTSNLDTSGVGTFEEATVTKQEEVEEEALEK